MEQNIKDYLATIGRKGGKAGKGTKLRQKLNQRAAIIRWLKKKSVDTTKAAV